MPRNEFSKEMLSGRRAGSVIQIGAFQRTHTSPAFSPERRVRRCSVVSGTKDPKPLPVTPHPTKL